jgi:hypothetical protein
VVTLFCGPFAGPVSVRRSGCPNQKMEQRPVGRERSLSPSRKILQIRDQGTSGGRACRCSLGKLRSGLVWRVWRERRGVKLLVPRGVDYVSHDRARKGGLPSGCRQKLKRTSALDGRHSAPLMQSSHPSSLETLTPSTRRVALPPPSISVHKASGTSSPRIPDTPSWTGVPGVASRGTKTPSCLRCLHGLPER